MLARGRIRAGGSHVVIAPILLHSELQMLILLHHLFHVVFSLQRLFELELLVLNLIFFFLDDCCEVRAKVFISPGILWHAARNVLHLSLELIDHSVLFRELKGQRSDLS